VQIVARYAAPNAFALAFIGADNTGLDYRGGHLVPYPPAVILTTTTDADGQILAKDKGVGGSFDLFLQLAVVDAGAPQGIELSEAIELVR
jgi:hypothetical protein